MKTIATLVIESGFTFKFNNITDLIIEMLWTESVDSDTFNDIWYETEDLIFSPHSKIKTHKGLFYCNR